MENVCEDCIHNVQHYSLAENGYHKVNCGHCTNLRLKKTGNRKSVCVHYKKISAKELESKKKAYATRRLLEIKELFARLCDYLNIDWAVFKVSVLHRIFFLQQNHNIGRDINMA